jgi:hypothetical protein
LTTSHNFMYKGYDSVGRLPGLIATGVKRTSMSIKIIRPEGTYELETEEDVLLFKKMFGTVNGHSDVAAPAVSTVAHEPARATAAPSAITRRRKGKTVKEVNGEQETILKLLQQWEPEAPTRNEIAELTEMSRQRVSEKLAELKRMDLVVNGAPPNSWKWQLTDRARTVGWARRK